MLNIKILGMGCANCSKLADMCKEITEGEKIDANIVKVTDMREIAEYGIMSTPALVINEQVIHSGKLPTYSTLANWLKKSPNI